MISPLIDQKTDLVSVRATIDGTILKDKFHIVYVEVEHHVNKLPYAKIELLDGDPSAQEMEVMDEKNFKPGMDIKIELGYHQELEKVFEGVISKVGYASNLKKHGRTQIECTDKCVGLTLTKDNEYFENKKDSAIVQQIVNTYSNISCEVEATDTTHPKIVQYNASDWDFILSRANACERVVIAESNTLKFIKAGKGEKKVKLTYGTDIIDFDLDVDGTTQRKKIKVKAWDASNHQFKEASSAEPAEDKQGSSDVGGSKLADALQFKEETIYAPSQLQDSEIKSFANSKLLHSRLSRVRGNLNMQGVASVKPNSYVQLEKVHKFYEGEVYISGVKHVMEDGNFKTNAIVGLDIDSYSGESTTGSTTDNLGLMPGPKGLFIGEVTKMDGDPDNDFRVQVKIPTFNETDQGLWAKLAGAYAGKEGGFIWFPEVGDQVVVGFIMNDPRYPVILGSLYSKTFSVFDDHKPASGNNQKAIVTREHMKILFEEDKKDITITTPGENFIKIMDSEKKIHLEDQHGNKIVMDSSGILIDSPKTITVKAGSKIDMDAVSSYTAKGSSIKLEGKTSSAELKAAAKASVLGAMIDVKASGITTIKGSLLKLN